MATVQSNISEKRDCLVNGYIVEYIVENGRKVAYPIELNKIIATFLGSIFLVFDIISESTPDDCIDKTGKLIKNTQNATTRVASSYCINNGVTYIDIKCIKPGQSDVIGITSNIDACKTGQWISLQKGYKYWWYGDTGIYGEKDQVDIVDKYMWSKSWQKNDVISMKIDCDQLELVWRLNQEIKHQVKIKESIDYHLFFMGQSENIEYQLL